MKSNNLRDIIVDAIQDKKGSSVCVIDLAAIQTAPTSTFIICQGKTPTQTSAIADNVIEKMTSLQHRKPARIDGMRNGQWIIIDYGDTMVHVFTPETREYYNLEDLWIDGKMTKIKDLD